MKSLVLLGLVALAWASTVKQPFYQLPPQQQLPEDYQYKQKTVLQLFQHVYQPDYFPEFQNIRMNYDFESNINGYTNPQYVYDFFKRYPANSLPKGEVFSIFYDQHRHEAIAFFRVLYSAVDFETFYKTAVWGRMYLNEGLYIYALSVACVHRPDTWFIELPPIYEIYPYYFYNFNVFQNAYEQTGNYFGNYQYLQKSFKFSYYFGKYFQNQQYPYTRIPYGRSFGMYQFPYGKYQYQQYGPYSQEHMQQYQQQQPFLGRYQYQQYGPYSQEYMQQYQQQQPLFGKYQYQQYGPYSQEYMQHYQQQQPFFGKYQYPYGKYQYQQYGPYSQEYVQKFQQQQPFYEKYQYPYQYQQQGYQYQQYGPYSEEYMQRYQQPSGQYQYPYGNYQQYPYGKYQYQNYGPYSQEYYQKFQQQQPFYGKNQYPFQYQYQQYGPYSQEYIQQYQQQQPFYGKYQYQQYPLNENQYQQYRPYPQGYTQKYQQQQPFYGNYQYQNYGPYSEEYYQKYQQQQPFYGKYQYQQYPLNVNQYQQYRPYPQGYMQKYQQQQPFYGKYQYQNYGPYSEEYYQKYPQQQPFYGKYQYPYQYQNQEYQYQQYGPYSEEYLQKYQQPNGQYQYPYGKYQQYPYGKYQYQNYGPYSQQYQQPNYYQRFQYPYGKYQYQQYEHENVQPQNYGPYQQEYYQNQYPYGNYYQQNYGKNVEVPVYVQQYYQKYGQYPWWFRYENGYNPETQQYFQRFQKYPFFAFEKYQNVPFNNEQQTEQSEYQQYGQYKFPYFYMNKYFNKMNGGQYPYFQKSFYKQTPFGEQYFQQTPYGKQFWKIQPQGIYQNQFYQQEREKIPVEYFQQQQQQQPVQGIVIDANNTPNFFQHQNYYNQEYQLSYFTEDVGLNAFYYYYHIYFPFWMKNEEIAFNTERRGEQFYYIYQQLLARYNLERISNGLGEIPVLQYEIPYGFQTELRYPNGLPFPERPDNAPIMNRYEVPVYDNDTMNLMNVRLYEKRILDAIDSGFVLGRDGKMYNLFEPQGLEILGNLIQANAESPNVRYYGPILEFARYLLGYSNYPLNEQMINPSVLEQFETSLRDPAFYQLYKRILYFFQRFKQYQPMYNQDELFFNGVKIQDVQVDKLITYFDYFYSDISSVMYGKNQAQDLPVNVRQWRLNNKPFNYYLNVICEQPVDAVVRVFLGPKYDVNGNPIDINKNRMNFVELDKFKYNLVPGLNTIQRNSRDFFGFVPDRTTYRELFMQLVNFQTPIEYNYQKVQWGLPQRLILPKGTQNGQTYQFYFLVTPYQPVERLTPRMYQETRPYLYWDKIYDNLPYGYPFDRQVDEAVFYVPNSYFKDVVIYNEFSPEFMQEYPQNVQY